MLTGISRTLGKWQEKSSHFSCVFPMDFEPDAALVRDVRLAIPDFVPVWLRRTYATPEGGEAHVDFVCAGRWTNTMDEPDRQPLKVERPSDFPFKGGYVYHQRTFSTANFGIAVPSEWEARGVTDLPLPFDRKLTNWIRAAHHVFANRSAEENKRDAMKLIEDEEKAREKVTNELDDEKSREFCDKVASPGMAKDADWEMRRGKSVSVQGAK